MMSLGTALPSLSHAIAASVASALAIGSRIGSNVLNVFLALASPHSCGDPPASCPNLATDAGLVGIAAARDPDAAARGSRAPRVVLVRSSSPRDRSIA
jgi:hypothetical protein